MTLRPCVACIASVVDLRPIEAVAQGEGGSESGGGMSPTVIVTSKIFAANWIRGV